VSSALQGNKDKLDLIENDIISGKTRYVMGQVVTDRALVGYAKLFRHSADSCLHRHIGYDRIHVNTLAKIERD
jgi:hypothetical protein